MWRVEGECTGACGVTVASAQGMRCAQSKTLWTRSPLSYNLLGHWHLGACVIQILGTMWPHLCVHYHCQNESIFLAGEGCASLGSVALGWGCCFSESYLLCSSSSSFVPFLPLVLLLCTPLLPNLPTLNFGKHICNICVHRGMGPPFHLMLYL